MTESSTLSESINSSDVAACKIWQVDVYPREGEPDRIAEQIVSDAVDLGLATKDKLVIRGARGFLIQAELDQKTIEQIATKLLVDSVVEQFHVSLVGDQTVVTQPISSETTIHVLPKPGVTDAEAESATKAINLLGKEVDTVRTFRRYSLNIVDPDQVDLLARKLMANESIEQIVVGPLQIKRLDLDQEYRFELRHAEILDADDDQLMLISRDWVLSLTLPEMQAIQEHYRRLKREPSDIELETIAQTWSEHCSHKTLAGKIEYKDESGVRHFENMLKETIFEATQSIRKKLGDNDWCVSVFKDNAGIIRFDDQNNLTFKVETHNRPSAIEPYGGASTGIGGVIRDTLGTGMGAKPICNTDVFCFADPNLDTDQLPPGVMHPRRIMKGVVSGVRDYGNRMGIPTVNGAVYFDQRYIGNPLVFCGNVGLIPHEHSFKEPKPDDFIVTLGGRTGRDGIHGATFSSAELTEKSEQTSSGAVQIGNAITEKMVVDVLLQARDQGLYNAVTDCGAGGFSSAVGEMGEEIGAEVWLEKAPLKYSGLSYTEIWISEAQERMVCSVPKEKWDQFNSLCRSEGVEANIIGQFKSDKRLTLKYNDQIVGELEMEFLHEGRPPVVRKAVYQPKTPETLSLSSTTTYQYSDNLLKILGSLNVASKHWIIRQYDHEVLGRSVVKPLVGAQNDGPSDAAVIRPVLDSYRGAAVACGMNPYYGDHDPYHMAASGIDEAIRNCVAVGADPERIAILDNFCWGYTDRPETLGTLVRAALACHDIATDYGTPFISGKDSLNNEFSYNDSDGNRKTISIPSTLLISALGQIPDVRNCVTMDLKQEGNFLYQVGETFNELGGSHLSLVSDVQGGNVPQVRTNSASKLYAKMFEAISKGLVKSCHDMSEGGLAVCIAEMAIAGRLGVNVDVHSIDVQNAGDAQKADQANVVRLFAESNSRFVVEVAPEQAELFESLMSDAFIRRIGSVADTQNVTIVSAEETLVELDLNQVITAWQQPLDWNSARTE